MPTMLYLLMERDPRTGKWFDMASSSFRGEMVTEMQSLVASGLSARNLCIVSCASDAGSVDAELHCLNSLHNIA